jgi:hypothetical protein
MMSRSIFVPERLLLHPPRFLGSCARSPARSTVYEQEGKGAEQLKASFLPCFRAQSLRIPAIRPSSSCSAVILLAVGSPDPKLRPAADEGVFYCSGRAAAYRGLARRPTMSRSPPRALFLAFVSPPGSADPRSRPDRFTNQVISTEVVNPFTLCRGNVQMKRVEGRMGRVSQPRPNKEPCSVYNVHSIEVSEARHLPILRT